MPTRKLQIVWKVLTFWYVMLYSLADVHQYSCEISVDFYWTVCHYASEESTFQSLLREPQIQHSNGIFTLLYNKTQEEVIFVLN